MKRTRALIIAGVSALGLTAAVATVQAFQPGPWQGQAGWGAEPAHFRGGGHGRHGGMGGPGFGRICSEHREERLDDMARFVAESFEFTPPQSEAWSGLLEAARGASASIGETCEELEQAGRPEAAPERLAHLETIMSTGLGAVQQVRPAFETFYGTLTAEQQEAFDDLVSRRGHHSRG